MSAAHPAPACPCCHCKARREGERLDAWVGAIGILAIVVLLMTFGCMRATVLEPTRQVDALLFGNCSIEVCQYTPTTEPVSPAPTSCVTFTTATTSTAEGIFAGLFGVISGLIAGGMIAP